MQFDWVSVAAYLKAQVLTNNFFSGAALGGMLLGLLAMARGWFGRVWAFGVRMATISMTVHSQDHSYISTCKWLIERQFDKFARTYRVRRVTGQTVLGPDYGLYFFKFNHKWIRVHVHKQDDGPTNAYGNDNNAQTRDFITIYYYGFFRTTLNKILAEVDEIYRASEKTETQVFSVQHGGWLPFGVVPKSGAMHVVLPAGTLEDLEQDIAQFLARAEWYHERGVPYRRGYLFSGIAGTGKTSIVRHLASKFDLPVYLLGRDNYVASLSTAIAEVPARSILLMEDVDCFVGTQREESDDDAPAVPTTLAETTKRADLGRLLNSLDGICPTNQVIVIMTTNHPEQLDPALVRPGRIDRKLDFGRCTSDQAKRLFQKFYPGENIPGDIPADRWTPAELQEIFIESATAKGALEKLWQTEAAAG